MFSIWIALTLYQVLDNGRLKWWSVSMSARLCLVYLTAINHSKRVQQQFNFIRVFSFQKQQASAIPSKIVSVLQYE